MSTETIEQTEHPDTGEEQQPKPDLFAQHDKAVRRQAAKVKELQAAHEQKKAEAKQAKDAYDAAAAELTDLCLQEPGYGPLFEGGDEQAGAEAWRSHPIRELIDHGAPSSAIEKAREHLQISHDPHAPAVTIGDLSDLMAKGEQWEQDVKGVDRGKAQQIEDALQAWFRANPELWDKEGDEDDDAHPEADD